MRWKTVILGLALSVALAAGCKQQCFMTECDWRHYQEHLGLPKDIECIPTSICQPPQGVGPKAPATVLDPDRVIRYLSLAEAISIALEQGTINGGGGSRQLNDRGLVSAAGRGISDQQLDSIRVLSLNPAIIGTDIELSLAKFDARWLTSMNWNYTDQPIVSAQQLFSSGGLNSIEQMQAQLRSQLIKPLPTGGIAGITFQTDYNFNNLPNRLNPSYTPNLQFQFEQPLLQGYGVEINQLRGQHPGSQLAQVGPFGGRTDGILITRIRFDQSRANFELNVDNLVLNVEQAYWNLYGAYWDVYAREQALRQAYEAFKITREKVRAGTKGVGDLAQSRGQYELFRGDRLEALGRVLEAERALRGFLGMCMEDGTRLVPSDEPTLAPYHPDWDTAVQQALVLRPEVVMAKQELKVRQLELINQKNLMLPDLRFQSTYEINAVGSRLDGDRPGNALQNLATNNFNNWQLGFRLDVPLGFREAHAGVRLARLNLARSYLVLKDVEYRTTRDLTQWYRELFTQHELIRTRRAQREAFAEQLRARFQEYLAGRSTLDILLEAQRFWANALSSEYLAVVAYQNALANFEYAKGTLMNHDSIQIAEGPLPQCAAVRAVEHERQRTVALVARERANAVPHSDQGPLLPSLPKHAAPTLPSLLGTAPPLPKEAAREAPPLEVAPAPMPMRPATPTPMPMPKPPATPARMPMPSATPTAPIPMHRGGVAIPSLPAGPKPAVLKLVPETTGPTPAARPTATTGPEVWTPARRP